MGYAWVDFDVNTVVQRVLHRLANGPLMVAVAQVLLRPIVELKAEQDALRARLLLETSYSGLTLVLEKCLNDAFDPTGRRLQIVNHSVYTELVYLRELGEPAPLVYLRETTEARPLTYLRELDEQGSGYETDFTVVCPLDIDPFPTEQAIARLVEKYRTTGKRWQIDLTDATTGAVLATRIMTQDPLLV
jgi:hypothetical protein